MGDLKSSLVEVDVPAEDEGWARDPGSQQSSEEIKTLVSLY